MAVVIRWVNASGAVDERLLLSGDGQAELVVLRPRQQLDRIGSFAGPVTGEETRALSALGASVELDLTLPDPAVAAIAVLAGGVADRLRAAPAAVAQFLARPLARVPSGALTVALAAVGLGSRATEFELDVPGCAVEFSGAGRLLSRAPMPELPVGFLTPDAEGLGGVRSRATVPAGTTGAIALEVVPPAGADRLSVSLAGLWYLAEDAPAEEFAARTEPAAW